MAAWEIALRGKHKHLVDASSGQEFVRGVEVSIGIGGGVGTAGDTVEIDDLLTEQGLRARKPFSARCRRTCGEADAMSSGE